MISIVSPVYNEAQGIRRFCEEITALFSKIDYNLELILCVDPSTDGTENVIADLHKEDQRIKSLIFSRRVGQDKATQAGIDFANGNAVIVMDADQQDPIETIPLFLKEWENGSKIVYATRVSRKKENYLKKASANLFYRILNSSSEIEIPRNTGDFRLMDKCVILELRKYREDSFFLRALTPLIGFESKKIEIARPAREVGETKYNRYFGGVKAAIRAIFGYTSFIQQFFLSITTLFFLFLIIFISFSLKIDQKTTYSSLEIENTIVIFGLVLLTLLSFSTWIIATYLNLIYKQVKNRPTYTVAKKIGISD